MEGGLACVLPAGGPGRYQPRDRRQDVGAAARTLARCYRYYPAETVFLVVVDPGVGTERRPLALRAGEHHFVAPDNGVLSAVMREQES